jgi:uncharacterized protein (TIGR00304 family)
MVQVFELGFLLIILGFVLAFVAVIVMLFQGVRSGSSESRGGAVLLIGPVPIIFGSDKKSAMVLVVLSIILIVIAMTFATIFLQG